MCLSLVDRETVANPFKTGENQVDTTEMTQTQVSRTNTTSAPSNAAIGDQPINHERRGRAWLIWSFVLCPCHLPFSMAFLAMIFGGTAFGTLISENTLWVGVAFGTLYAAGVAVGFKHLRKAAAGADCSGGECTIS